LHHNLICWNWHSGTPLKGNSPLALSACCKQASSTTFWWTN